MQIAYKTCHDISTNSKGVNFWYTHIPLGSESKTGESVLDKFYVRLEFVPEKRYNWHLIIIIYITFWYTQEYIHLYTLRQELGNKWVTSFRMTLKYP
jgi:hypothetical protein